MSVEIHERHSLVTSKALIVLSCLAIVGACRSRAAVSQAEAPPPSKVDETIDLGVIDLGASEPLRVAGTLLLSSQKSYALHVKCIIPSTFKVPPKFVVAQIAQPRADKKTLFISSAVLKQVPSSSTGSGAMVYEGDLSKLLGKGKAKLQLELRQGVVMERDVMLRP